MSLSDSCGAGLVLPSAEERRRPGGLTFVCIVAMVLGGLGAASSGVGLCALVAKPWMRRAMQPQQTGKPDRVKDAQLQMQKEMDAATDRFEGFTLGAAVVNVFLGSLLLIGGILGLQLHPKAIRILAGVFAVAIVFEILRSGLQFVIQLEMAKVMSTSLVHMVEAAGPPGAGPQQTAVMTATVARIVSFVMLALTLGFGLLKIGFYGFGASYLRRPNIRRLFERGHKDETTSPMDQPLS